MYSLEQRKKAVELYIEYDFHESRVIRELGYPTLNNTYLVRRVSLYENVTRRKEEIFQIFNKPDNSSN